MSTFDPNLYSNTPSVSVTDGRGLLIRQLDFFRQESADEPEIRIIKNHWNSRALQDSTMDARLSATLNQPNVIWQYDLLGNVIKTSSSDSGIIVTLVDIENRPLLTIDAAGNQRTNEYEPPEKSGRLLLRKEKKTSGQTVVTDRYYYADYTSEEKAYNLGGLATRVYDSAGLSRLQGNTINGKPTKQTRQLLIDNSTAPNWAADDEQELSKQLVKTDYANEIRYNSLGQILSTIDSAGNQWRYNFNRTGQIDSTWIKLSDQSEQKVVLSISYNANGQKIKEVHANNCSVLHEYDEKTLRLASAKVIRSTDDGKTQEILQDLEYSYDPAGNVIGKVNHAEDTRYWKNQKTHAQQTFKYDSLYQLIECSGREAANNIARDKVRLSILGANTPEFVNYVRQYTYDAAGNMVMLRHTGAENYTRKIAIASDSNRGILSDGDSNDQTINSAFDVYGNLLNLDNDVNLIWNSRGELQQADTVVRKEGDNDGEFYVYNGNSLRIQKNIQTKVNGALRKENVNYLEGLESHERSVNGVINEAWQVVNQQISLSDIRILRWTTGKPGGIENNQIRYSYDDLTGNTTLEIDSKGEIISREEYFPFGGTSCWLARNDVEASYKTLRYSGKERDNTGLYYYGFRYYQSHIARWISADPLVVAAGINRYSFVMNNPVTTKDIAGLIRPEDLSPEYLALIGAIEGPPDPTYGTELATRQSWINTPVEGQFDPLRDTNINPFAPQINRAAEQKHEELLTQSQTDKLRRHLSVGDERIINIYSQESQPFHAMMLGWKIEKGYYPRQASLLRDALKRITPYQGKTYRGALLMNTVYPLPSGYSPRKQNTINVGDLVTTSTFFSTSAEPKVASEFAVRQRFGNSFEFDTVVFEIEGLTGRNITELTHIRQAEVLFSPGSVFEVTGITAQTYGIKVNLKERDADAIWSDPTKTVRDYRFGWVVAQRPKYPSSQLAQ